MSLFLVVDSLVIAFSESRQFFTSENSVGSPSKRRRLSPQAERDGGLDGGLSHRSVHDDSSSSMPIIVDDTEEEEELVGDAHQDADESEDEGFDELESVNFRRNDEIHVARDVPSFRYRSPTTTNRGVARTRNTTQSPMKRPQKPNSTNPKGSGFTSEPSSRRSKSEQPIIRSSILEEKQTSPNISEVESHQPQTSRDGDRNSREHVPRNREKLVCPICSRELKTDNSGLNAHIDFCLSRGAIMEASAASTSTMPVTHPRKPKERTNRTKGQLLVFPQFNFVLITSVSSDLT